MHDGYFVYVEDGVMWLESEYGDVFCDLGDNISISEILAILVSLDKG